MVVSSLGLSVAPLSVASDDDVGDVVDAIVAMIAAGVMIVVLGIEGDFVIVVCSSI